MKDTSELTRTDIVIGEKEKSAMITKGYAGKPKRE